ncbi:F-box/kelch-repeat protein [Thalictrum thalictroides]|uniref:F-box/kelch-repeat protein n=1 Tax=Thalictrum thalictroides TaxID=46969 RepID=A0A7J6WCT2_THATH|nr:F-box/kelch-repeat protein [Thalictrum thalictroides]
MGITPNNSEIDNKSRMKEEDDEERWSHLPAVLLWLIKDRLNIADTTRLALVCKHWEASSLNCPSRSVGHWLMHRLTLLGTKCEFVNVSTMEKLTLDLPKFVDNTTFLFSRRGWLLFRSAGYDKGGRKCSLVLLNVHTNAKIIMPDPGRSVEGGIASFSAMEDDTPQYVVFANRSNTLKGRALYIGDVNDKIWTKHSYEDGRIMENIASLVVTGHKVYLLDVEGGLLIFDTDKLSWQKVDRDEEQNPIYKKYYQIQMTESEQGDILMIDGGVDLKTYRFFRLNHNHTGWEELSLKTGLGLDRSWFLGFQNNHFSVKDSYGGWGTNKVYQLTTNYPFLNKLIINIHDLSSGSTQDYKPQHQHCVWVDLGWMHKVPPSCVFYVPSHQY